MNAERLIARVALVSTGLCIVALIGANAWMIFKLIKWVVS
jgi:hypothetical protein